MEQLGDLRPHPRAELEKLVLGQRHLVVLDLGQGRERYAGAHCHLLQGQAVCYPTSETERLGRIIRGNNTTAD